MDKPKEEEFVEWFAANADVEITPQDTVYYNTAVLQMREQLINSSFWGTLCSNLNEYSDQFYGQYKDTLLKERKPPEIDKKSFSSLMNKVYRQNIVDNELYPDPPESGWTTPANWFSKMNDILRTTIVVKYLDGVEYLSNKLETLCKEESNLIDKCHYIARIDGYYAAHLYFKMEFEIAKKEWDTQRVVLPIEIQITTQVKEVIKELLHIPYEKARLKSSSEADAWLWEYDSPEFGTNYLGHIIHYVEGMIVGIRRSKNE